jgi:hypothetical protein
MDEVFESIANFSKLQCLCQFRLTYLLSLMVKNKKHKGRLPDKVRLGLIEKAR